jgi:phospholipid/cholesterol/gamma-HCH transport system substrate-binding protein
MEAHTQKFKIRLGLFIAGGLALFVFAIFIIGKQKNLFNPVFEITANFKNISGLQVGNNVRFSGIAVGTVDDINIINDSTIKVDMLIRKEVMKFMKSDCIVAIGSEGLIGDRLMVISHGSPDAPPIKEGQQLASMEPVETDAIMASLQVTAENAEFISAQLAEIIFNINSGKGTIGRLIQDTAIAGDMGELMYNLKTSSKSLDENMEAAKHNFLLKGYFKDQEKAAAKLKEEQQKEADKQQKADEKKARKDARNADDPVQEDEKKPDDEKK